MATDIVGPQRRGRGALRAFGDVAGGRFLEFRAPAPPSQARRPARPAGRSGRGWTGAVGALAELADPSASIVAGPPLGPGELHVVLVAADSNTYS